MENGVSEKIALGDAGTPAAYLPPGPKLFQAKSERLRESRSNGPNDRQTASTIAVVVVSSQLMPMWRVPSCSYNSAKVDSVFGGAPKDICLAITRHEW